ncbi:MAG: metallophosphoesterase [Clostridia bacterium]|nr:metallophosphoesterase [Clostridia bacterium]
MKQQLNIIRSELFFGLEKPLRFLHITDTHITRGDPSGRRRREEVFNQLYENCAEDYFLQAIAYAKENGMPVLHTGDMIDFLSERNFDFLDEHFANIDYMYAAGNHDFCHWVGRAKEDYAYKWENIKKIAPHIRSNLYFDSRIIGGVNFVTLDNSYYLISEGQTEMLRAEVAKGYPVLLAMHVPLYTETLAKIIMAKNNPCAYLTGAPEELLAVYPEDRRLQQTPDEATRRAVDYICNEPLIKAVVTGHTHLNFEEDIGGKYQYTTNGTYEGDVREFLIR